MSWQTKVRFVVVFEASVYVADAVGLVQSVLSMRSMHAWGLGEGKEIG